MRAYRVACELIDDAWKDVEKLKHDKATEKISGQLYASVGSIAGNLAEGYAHSSGRDRARIFEYALGSARESMVWYRRQNRFWEDQRFSNGSQSLKKSAAYCWL